MLEGHPIQPQVFEGVEEETKATHQSSQQETFREWRLGQWRGDFCKGLNQKGGQKQLSFFDGQIKLQL